MKKEHSAVGRRLINGRWLHETELTTRIIFLLLRVLIFTRRARSIRCTYCHSLEAIWRDATRAKTRARPVIKAAAVSRDGRRWWDPVSFGQSPPKWNWFPRPSAQFLRRQRTQATRRQRDWCRPECISSHGAAPYAYRTFRCFNSNFSIAR